MHLLFAVLLVSHWLLASDLHVEPGPGAAVPAAYEADTNWALLDSTITAMRKADPNPQVVILSGDFLAHHFPNDVPLAVRTMRRIAHRFNAAFPHAQFVIVPGNNDDPCGDYRATPGDAYFRSFAHVWAPLVNRNGAAPNFERSFAQRGWYVTRLPANLHALALDTVYWSVIYRRCANVNANATRQQLQWFVKTLSTLPPHARAVVVMHIPPGVDPGTTVYVHRLLLVPYWPEQISRAFVRVLAANRRRVAFAVAGHEHRDAFRLFGGVPLLIAPSVSPVYGNNPAFLRLDVAADGSLRDYRQFYYDEWAGTWQTSDSFDQTFGVHAFSGAALASIHARLPDDRDLLVKWARLFTAQSHRPDITRSTWRFYWCAQTNIGAAYVACAGLQRRLEVLPIAAGVGVAALLVLVAFLAVRLARQRASR